MVYKRTQQQQQHQLPPQHQRGATTTPHAGATSVEVFGFVAWLASFAAAGLFGAWALLPERVLQAAGVSYYANREWALLVPCYLVVTVLLAYWAYESLNMTGVPPPGALCTLQDGVSKWVTDIPGLASAAGPTHHSIPPLVHLPAPLVSRVLFGGQPFAQAEAHLFGRHRVRGDRRQQ